MDATLDRSPKSVQKFPRPLRAATHPVKMSTLRTNSRPRQITGAETSAGGSSGGKRTEQRSEMAAVMELQVMLGGKGQ